MSKRQPPSKSSGGETPGLAAVLHEGLSTGVLVLDAQGRVLCSSPGAARLRQQPAGRLVDAGLTAMPTPVQQLVREAFAASPGTVLTRAGLEVGNTSARLQFTATRFAGGDGAAQVLLTFQDAAVVERLEHNLHRLDRLAGIGTLSAGLAHEIKNAFVAVRTFVTLLLEKHPEAELGDVVQRELRRIDTILSQMLRFRTPARPAFVPVHVHEVLEHTLRLLQHQLDARLIKLNRACQAASDLVLGDDYHLEQAFVNLCFNALDAAGPNGTLTIRTEVLPASDPANPSVGPRLCVSVTDDGVGIPPENLARLFEPFFTTKQNGTGLGMAITRRIVRDHGGDIQVESRVNHGTTFRVLLPLHGGK